MNKQELLKLYDMDLNELVEMAEQVTKSNFTNEVEVCSIISAKPANAERTASTALKVFIIMLKSSVILFWMLKM